MFISDNLDNLDNHITLTSSQSVKDICKPLFDNIGVGYFTYHRIYDDATTIRLSTYPEWSKHYIIHNYFSFFSEDHFPCTAHDREYLIWNDYLNSSKIDPLTIPIIKQSINDFSINYGFTVLRRYPNYCESFNMGYLNTFKNHNSTDYLSKIDFIEKFCFYFVEQAHQLIKQATEVYFKTCFSHKYHNDKPKDLIHDCPKSNILTSRRLYSSVQYDQLSNFTSREQDCLNYLLKGCSAKEIARLLNFSFRTIEFHINNIHKKTGFKKNIDIINYLKNFNSI